MNILDKLIETHDRSEIDALLERKDHLIKKIPSLDDTQKQKVIDFFARHPNYENKIDWNNLAELTYEDFEKLFDVGTIGNAFNTLKKDEDYIEVFDKAFDDTPGLIGVYMPLNHNAANVLAKKAGGLKASWCVGYDGDDGYWYSYSYGLDNSNYSGDGYESVFFIVIKADAKWAVQVQTDNDNRIIIWDAGDTPHGDANDTIPMFDTQNLVKSKAKLITDVRKHLDDAGKHDERLSELRDEQEYMYVDDIEIGDTTTISNEVGLREGFLDPHGMGMDYELTVLDTDRSDDTVKVEYRTWETIGRSDWSDVYYSDKPLEVVESVVDEDVVDMFDSTDGANWFGLTAGRQLVLYVGGELITLSDLPDYDTDKLTKAIADSDFSFDDIIDGHEADDFVDIKSAIIKYMTDNEDDLKLYLLLDFTLDDIRCPFIRTDGDKIIQVGEGDTIRVGRYGTEEELIAIDVDEYDYLDTWDIHSEWIAAYILVEESH